MTLRRDGDMIRLVGDLHVEDAEILVGLMQQNGVRAVHVGECGTLHAAVLQVLLTSLPEIRGRPADDFTARLLSSVAGSTIDGAGSAVESPL